MNRHRAWRACHDAAARWRMRRRQLLAALPLALLGLGARAQYAPVRRGTRLSFPRDHGAHPDYRTEWWYLTGWVTDPAGRDLGIQITFFRNRPLLQEANPSPFAPRQLLFAHAAVADPREGSLLHDQRAARAGLGLAEAGTHTTDVRLDDWSLVLEHDTYRSRIVSRAFGMELRFVATQAPMLQGVAGFSRKGEREAQASHYYSRPHLATEGDLTLHGRQVAVRGSAWLDHEWSSTILDERAAGWDWIGINLHDGGALMLFRIRGRDGGVLYVGGGLRDGRGRFRSLDRAEVAFEPLRTWRSPRTNVDYPVAMRVRAAGAQWVLQPLMDDQELDSRASTGTIYWEGAVRAMREGREVGRGYLELTGYWQPLRV